MGKQRNSDHCWECGRYIGGKPEDHYCVSCEHELRDEKICRHCDRPLGGVEIQSTWHDIGNGVWEEKIHLRLEDQRGESQRAFIILLEDDTEE